MTTTPIAILSPRVSDFLTIGRRPGTPLRMLSSLVHSSSTLVSASYSSQSPSICFTPLGFVTRCLERPFRPLESASLSGPAARGPPHRGALAADVGNKRYVYN